MKPISTLLIVLAIAALVYGMSVLVNNTEEEPPVDGEENGEVVENGDEDEGALPNTVNVYLVDLEAGNVGCGDAVVAVERQITPTQGVLVAALEELFSLRALDYDEDYYNALESSDLSVANASVENGVANVEITGNVSVGGVCDEPRFEEQIRQTVMQFETVNSANITVNGTPLEDLFNEQGA